MMLDWEIQAFSRLLSLACVRHALKKIVIIVRYDLFSFLFFFSTPPLSR